jgi:hypothetical protein
MGYVLHVERAGQTEESFVAQPAEFIADKLMARNLL